MSNNVVTATVCFAGKDQATGSCPYCHERSGIAVCSPTEGTLPKAGQPLVCLTCTGFITISDKRELVALELDQIPGDALIGALETRRLAVMLVKSRPDALNLLRKAASSETPMCTCGHGISDHRRVGDDMVCMKCAEEH